MSANLEGNSVVREDARRRKFLGKVFAGEDRIRSGWSALIFVIASAALLSWVYGPIEGGLADRRLAGQRPVALGNRKLADRRPSDRGPLCDPEVVELPPTTG